MTAPNADQRILRGTNATLRWQFVDGDGEPADLAGPVTVGVTNHAGTELIAAGTSATVSGSIATVTLPANLNADLDLLTAKWAYASAEVATTIEVAGGFLFSVADARSYSESLSREAKFSDAAVLAARRQIEDDFEHICNVAFVPRFRVDTLEPEGGYMLHLPISRVRTIRSVTAEWPGFTDWTDADLADLVYDGSNAVTSTGRYFSCAPTTVAYEHGMDRPPAALKTAALEYLRYILTKPTSGITDKATSFTAAEGGTFRLDQASKWRVGIPDIDAELQRWSRRVPGLG